MLHMSAMNDDPEPKPVPTEPSKKSSLWALWIGSALFPGLALAVAMAMDKAGNFVIPALGLGFLSLIANIITSARLGSTAGTGCLFVLGGLLLTLACFFVGCVSAL